MNTVLLVVFASIALVIASVGIYGVLAYSVSQRTGENGLRMALGASRGDIFRLVTAESILVAITGIGVGLIGAITVGKAMSSLIYGVSVRDPATFTIAAALLLMVALAACIFPGLRATRPLPTVALRHG
jgi:putative ABC transport system permease protein